MKVVVIRTKLSFICLLTMHYTTQAEGDDMGVYFSLVQKIAKF